MAFNQAIEADRVDDFGLLSAIIHAPLWILGTVLGSGKSKSDDDDDDDDKENGGSHRPDDNAKRSQNSSTPGNIDSSSNPPLLRARGEPLERARAIEHANNIAAARSPTSSMDAINSFTDTGELYGLKRTKKMSWSDESGQRLVEYADESARLEESSPSVSSSGSSAAKPGRSAIRRSRSLRSTGTGNLENLQDRTRYIPKMTRAENSLIMPTRPYGVDPSGNGVESPQWGWYTNITPPTPEMHYGGAKHAKLSETSFQPSNSTSVETKPQHNQVFQNLQSTKGPMRWPSVPI